MKKKLIIFSFIFVCICGSNVYSLDGSDSEKNLQQSYPLKRKASDDSSSSSILSDEEFRNLDPHETAYEPLKPINRSDNEVHIYICNVGSGNCVFLHGPNGVVVIDAGTSQSYQNNSLNFERFCQLNQNILKIFKDIKYITFVATHSDKDHCNFIPSLAQLAIQRSPKVVINFCIGGYNKEVQEFFKDCQIACPETSFQFFVHVTQKRDCCKQYPHWQHINDIENEKILLPDEGQPSQLNVATIESLLTKTLGNFRTRFHLLIPIKGLVHPDESNSQSLVILFEHLGSSILFTGDATGETLEAILGDRSIQTKEVDSQCEKFFMNASKSEIEKSTTMNFSNIVSAISKRNRHLLKCVNLMMASHHGSDKEGCDLWVPQIIKLSKDNFCGFFSSSDPIRGQYGHDRHTTVSTVSFPESAKSFPKSVVTCTVMKEGSSSDRFQRKKAKTERNIFQTALVSAYQILCQNEGMSIYYNGLKSPQQLTSSGGFSVYTQGFWNLFLNNDEKYLWKLDGAVEANSSLLKTATISRNSPLSLQLNKLLSSCKENFLSHVRTFIEEFKPNSIEVSGIESLDDALTEIPTLQKDLMIAERNGLPLCPDIEIPVRTVYGGDQGIHELDTCFQENPEIINQFKNKVLKYFKLQELENFPLDTFFEKIQKEVLSSDCDALVSDIIRTIENNVNVLKTTLEFLKKSPSRFNNLIKCLEEALKSKNSLNNDSFKKKIQESINELVKETLDLATMHIKTNSIGPDIQTLINLIPIIEVDTGVVVRVILDNVFMGGWCAQGYRNRLFDLLRAQWESRFGGQNSN